MTYLRRFYLINPSLIEFPPKHMLIACIFLASKIEEKTEKGSVLKFDKYNHFFKNDKDVPAFSLLEMDPYGQQAFATLCRELWFKDANYRDGLNRLRYFEIELCKALNFEFMVHNPLSIIHHVRFQFFEYFKDNQTMLKKLKDKKLYGKNFDRAENHAGM